MRTPTGNTSVVVTNKAPVVTVRNRITDDMMHDAVTKISRPYFPDFRMGHDKSNAAANFIVAAAKLVVQLYKIGFQIDFKAKLVNRIALGFAAVKIGVEYGINRKAGFHHRHTPIVYHESERGDSTPRRTH